MLGNIVQHFEWPLVRKALYESSPFTNDAHRVLGRELGRELGRMLGRELVRMLGRELVSTR